MVYRYAGMLFVCTGVVSYALYISLLISKLFCIKGCLVSIFRAHPTVKRVDEVVRHPHLVTQDQFTQVSKKVSDIPEENFTINIELFRHFSQVSNFFAINIIPNVVVHSIPILFFWSRWELLGMPVPYNVCIYMLLYWRIHVITAIICNLYLMASSRLTNKSPKTHVYGVTNNWRNFSSYIWRITVHIN